MILHIHHMKMRIPQVFLLCWTDNRDSDVIKVKSKQYYPKPFSLESSFEPTKPPSTSSIQDA